MSTKNTLHVSLEKEGVLQHENLAISVFEDIFFLACRKGFRCQQPPL